MYTTSYLYATLLLCRLLIVGELNSFVIVVSVEADNVVAVIVSGVLTVEAVPINVVGALYSLRDKDKKITTAMAEPYFGFICLDNATGNKNT